MLFFAFLNGHEALRVRNYCTIILHHQIIGVRINHSALRNGRYCTMLHFITKYVLKKERQVTIEAGWFRVAAPTALMLHCTLIMLL